LHVTFATLDAVAGIRERTRAENTAEIVRIARDQVAQHGAADLSLRAVARELGMVSSAMYRYFASRDELLTRLIVDSYDRLGEAVEQADARVRRDDFRGRWRAEAMALRTWAVAHPTEYALLFGTPVPDYAAPQDTIGPASRYTVVLLNLLVDMENAGLGLDLPVPPKLRRDFARLRARFPVPADDALLMLGMSAWAAVMGVISLELFGHLHNVVDTPGALYEAVVDQHAAQLFPSVAGDGATAPGTRARRRTSKTA
jgi:AcrR family transcriptional regulator